jgi:ribosome recycling factor
MDSKEVIEQLKTKNADVLIFVTINEWRNDTRPYKFSKVATEMLWNFEIQVFDNTGTLKVENSIQGRDGGINPSGATSTKKIQKIIDVYYKDKMEELFSGVDITTKK